MITEENKLSDEEIESFSIEELRDRVKILQDRIIVALKKISLFREIAEDLIDRDQLQQATIEMLKDVNETLFDGLQRLERKIETLQPENAERRSQKPKT